MGFLDNLKESLTPRPDRYDPPAPEPWVTSPGRPQLRSGDNEVYLVRVPYPAEGSATVDFVLDLMRPAKSIYYPVIMNPGTPLAAYAFNPQGINLSSPIPSTINNPLFDLTPGQLTRWKTAFDRLYVSVNGQGTGGFITLLVSDGMELITANPSQTTDLHKLTIVETTTPLAANGVFTGAWHDSQADGVLYVTATVYASQNSATNGFVIQESDDISNANLIRTIQVGNSIANTIGRITTAIKCRYWRVVFTNTTTAQTTMELTTTASDILNQNNYAGDTVDVNVPVQAIAFPTPISSITDNAVSNNFVPITEINAGTTASAPTEAFVPIYGGAFSGTANAALQGWSRPRTPTVFKTITATAAGNTAVWTPGSGNKFRLLGYVISVTGDASLAAAGRLSISLADAATTLNFIHQVYLPAAAPAAPLQQGFQVILPLGAFGVLSAAANNALNVQLSSALTSGLVNVIAYGTEE
jgi:hypothetical protein